HTMFSRDWSSDVCSSDLIGHGPFGGAVADHDPVIRVLSLSLQQLVRRALVDRAHCSPQLGGSRAVGDLELRGELGLTLPCRTGCGGHGQQLVKQIAHRVSFLMERRKPRMVDALAW